LLLGLRGDFHLLVICVPCADIQNFLLGTRLWRDSPSCFLCSAGWRGVCVCVLWIDVDEMYMHGERDEWEEHADEQHNLFICQKFGVRRNSSSKVRTGNKLMLTQEAHYT